MSAVATMTPEEIADWEAKLLSRELFPPKQEVHGASRYDWWGCRCPVCWAAKAEKNRASRSKRRHEREASL